MEEIIRVQDQHYIIATAARLNDRVRVLKHGDTFAVFDPYGDILPIGHGEQGLYHEGTRYLSRMEFRLQDRRPFLLSSSVKERVSVLSVDLTNPDIFRGEELLLSRNTLHVRRSIFLWKGTCQEELRIRNFGLSPVDARLSFSFDSDFADIFEVRGFVRQSRGKLAPPHRDDGTLLFAYEGLDRAVRRLRILASPGSVSGDSREIRFTLQLPPKGEALLWLVLACEGPGLRPALTFQRQALERCQDEIRMLRTGDVRISSSNPSFDGWLNRSAMDLHMMISRTPHGPYPYAGVPWFSTVFGRDGILTALEYLWVKPSLARGVLSHLAATQAREAAPEKEAEPGKIIHEERKGELAALGEIPFGAYYGSVDATPLFVVLAGAYYEVTGDRAFLREIWPNIRRALDWLEGPGDPDGDGFVEYAAHPGPGLVNHGWKDSHDSIFHADGELASGPIALCEVQAYAYAAKLCGAELAEVLGEAQEAQELRRKAHALRVRFEEAFWSEELGLYVLALDGAKRPCRVRASNAGHALFSGIAVPERAARIAETLLDESFFSGWGIRTVSQKEIRYNPMSYHNGSVWPHDNALIASGFARYPGAKGNLLKVFTGLFEASGFVELRRLPELFCGFRRQPGEGPTLYPVACSPQAWSAGAVFLLLQACLGLTIDAPRGRVRFQDPMLPEWLPYLSLRDLRVGKMTVDLEFRRHRRDVEVTVIGRRGDLQVIVVK